MKSSPYKKIVEATQKKKIKQATKSKTNWLALNAVLGPSKRQKRRVCRDPTSSDTPSDSDTDPAVPFTGRFSEDHNEEDWI
jgi:ABC-type oligopeptide transport system ATPase subunit